MHLLFTYNSLNFPKGLTNYDSISSIGEFTRFHYPNVIVFPYKNDYDTFICNTREIINKFDLSNLVHEKSWASVNPNLIL